MSPKMARGPCPRMTERSERIGLFAAFVPSSISHFRNSVNVTDDDDENVRMMREHNFTDICEVTLRDWRK